MLPDGRHQLRPPVRRSSRDWTVLPIHPLLAAAYPVIFLFALNIAEQVTLDPLWLPLGLAVVDAGLLLGILGLATRDWQRAALLTTVVVVGFFGYGHAWMAASTFLDSQWPLIAAWLLAVGIGLAVAWRIGRHHLRTITRVLNAAALFLVVVNLTTILATRPILDFAPATANLSPIELAPPDPSDLPDVYFVILDRYGGPTALRDIYDFDNEPFLTELEARGFQVARNAHANYIKTGLSLAGTLSMEPLDGEALRAQGDDGADRNPVQRTLSQRLAVPAAFKELGYEYVHIGNWWTPTATNVDADLSLVYEGQDQFGSVLAQTTFLRAIDDPAGAPDDPWDWPVMRENNLYALDRLDEVTSLPGPKYVFAHLVTTHPPYVHNADGSYTGREQVAELGEIESYRRQLTYANSRMLSFVDRVLARDPEAIIILQADEGPFPARYQEESWNFKWRDATPEELEQKFGILFAMRVPDADLEAEGFHDAITPVNTFRILFNARYGADLPLLPDEVWAHEDLYNFYDFFQITDRLRR
jgi:hypothetical protein